MLFGTEYYQNLNKVKPKQFFTKENSKGSPFLLSLIMEPLIVQNYAIHFEWIYETTLQFKIYPIIEWEDFFTKKSGVYYQDKMSGKPYDNPNDDCSCAMSGTYCWRGVWEGRIYFTDEEYWIEDLQPLSELINTFVIPFCEGQIKLKDPHQYYDK